PVILEPGRDVFVESGREEPVFNLAAHVAEQERGDAVAAERITLVPDPLREAAAGGQLERVSFVPDDVLRPAYVRASAPGMRPANPGDIRVCGHRVRDVVARRPTEGNVTVARLVASEHDAARQRFDQARREAKRRLVKAHVFFTDALLLEAVEGEAE